MTITPILDTRTPRKNNLYPIFIRISHGKKQRLIPTGFRLEQKYWITDRVVKIKEAAIINSRIAEIISNAQTYYAECKMHNRPIRIELIGTGNSSHSFTKYLIHRSEQYRAKNQIVSSRKVLRLATELTQCFGSDLYFNEITQDDLRKLEAWQIKAGNHQNTRADKFEKMGQFFTHATTEGKATIANPFKAYKINRKPVKREKLTPEEIARIENLELTGSVNDARNLFLFSYYCKGQRFEQCIMVRRKDIKNGRIDFRTNKGNKYISVKIHDRLQAIIDHCGKDFLFPYVDAMPESEEERLKLIDVCNVMANRNLKIVMGIARIDKHVTMHCSRHTFAFHLKQNNTSIHVIKEALGHSNTRITEVYLKNLDDTAIDGEMDKLYG